MENKQVKDSEVKLTLKKGHKDSVNKLIRYSDEDQDKFFSASNDKSIRLWDLRVGGSVKKFTDKSIGEEMAGLAYSTQKGIVYASSVHEVY